MVQCFDATYVHPPPADVHALPSVGMLEGQPRAQPASFNTQPEALSQNP